MGVQFPGKKRYVTIEWPLMAPSPVGLQRLLDTVAYPGFFFGCPETPPPPAKICFKIRGLIDTGNDLYQPLKFATFGYPLKTNSGYATATIVPIMALRMLYCLTAVNPCV